MTNEETVLIGLTKELADAILAPDKSRIALLLAADFQGVGYAGQAVDKSAFSGVHTDASEGEGQFSEYRVENPSASVTGDLGFVRGTQHVTARIKLISRFVHIWRREGKQWRLAYYQETAIVDPASIRGE